MYKTFLYLVFTLSPISFRSCWVIVFLPLKNLMLSEKIDIVIIYNNKYTDFV